MKQKTATEQDVQRWAITAALAADDKKATDTVILNVQDLGHYRCVRDHQRSK